MSRRKAAIERDVQRLTDLEKQFSDLQALVELIGEQEDPELQEELANGLIGMETFLDTWRLERLLSGKHDNCPGDPEH